MSCTCKHGTEKGRETVKECPPCAELSRQRHEEFVESMRARSATEHREMLA